MSIERSLLWYDLETFGTHPGADRIAQIALQRTNESLEPIEPAICHRVQVPWHYLPDPGSCLVTGLTPQACADGLEEPALAELLASQMGMPATVIAGYNSIRFDDEFVRHLFWRQLRDPYAREWQGGNQRFDLLDVARMCHALRPAGIQWPLRQSQGAPSHDDGCPSFRLEDLVVANQLPQPQAHDALSDVQATIALARLIRSRQPRLYAWARRMSDKEAVRDLLQGGQPLVHVSGRYWGPQGCARLVLPLGQHAEQRNKIAVIDLQSDPRQWAAMDTEALAEAIFRRHDAEPTDEPPPRPAVKFVHIGRCPMLAPASVLRGVDCARIGIDEARCQRHADWLARQPGLCERLLQALQQRPPPAGEPDMPPADPELALYQGFVSRADRQRLDALRAQPQDPLPAFDDPRLAELAWRWQHPQSDAGEPRWHSLLRQRLEQGHGRTPPWPMWREQLDQRLRTASPGEAAILEPLMAWGKTASRRLGLTADGSPIAD